MENLNSVRYAILYSLCLVQRSRPYVADLLVLTGEMCIVADNLNFNLFFDNRDIKYIFDMMRSFYLSFKFIKSTCYPSISEIHSLLDKIFHTRIISYNSAPAKKKTTDFYLMFPYVRFNSTPPRLYIEIHILNLKLFNKRIFYETIV